MGLSQWVVNMTYLKSSTAEKTSHKTRSNWKWKAAKYIGVPSALVGVGFVMGASYGSNHAQSWPSRYSSATIGAVESCSGYVWHKIVGTDAKEQSPSDDKKDGLENK